MAFTPVEIPIQEILQTDFITDIGQIHNTNVLLLKDKIEDLLNTLEIDINGVTIGTDSPINSIKTVDLVLQDGGFIFQTGNPNDIIARLSKDVNDNSVFDVDFIDVDVEITAAHATFGTLSVGQGSSFNSIDVTNLLRYNGSIVESKETVSALLSKDLLSPTTAVATVTLTNTSKKNIYINLVAEESLVSTQVWNGSNFGTVTELILKLDFDASNPPLQNQSFTIHIVDVKGSIGNTSILASIRNTPIAFQIKAGTNQSISQDILLHYGLTGLAGLTKKLGLGLAPSNLPIYEYGCNVSFNYIKDNLTKDRLIIQSMIGLQIY